MCSLSWATFPDRLAICFNRDESVNRPKALLPKIFQDNNTQYIMPVDPQGQGSWLAVNEYGLAFCLLNDYQGQLKAQTNTLVSRGILIRNLASCQNWQQVEDEIIRWPLENSQPFKLLAFTQNKQGLWHYSGADKNGANQLQHSKTVPFGIYSSGHPHAEKILQQRSNYRESLSITDKTELLALHRGHFPKNDDMIDGNDGRAYSFCMHRPEARSQSMTYIELMAEKVSLEYWDGQPCETDHSSMYELSVTA